jgi:hypothetical protein
VTFEELIDYRQSEPPVALWHNMIVLSVHHDQAGTIPAACKDLSESLLCNIIYGNGSGFISTMANPAEC